VRRAPKIEVVGPAVRAALESRSSWAKIRTALAALTNEEWAQAENLERLGQRRAAHMRICRNLRYQRAHKMPRGGMLHLKVESNL
jgi:hypothetical protein